MSLKKNETTDTSGFQLTLTRVINVPCALVYRAWTEPAQLAQWFSPAEVELRRATTEIKVGGAFRFHMVSKNGDHIATGTYLEIIPDRRLQFTWTWETYAMPDSVVTVDFEDLGGTTRLTLRHEGLPDQEDADQHTHGWTSMFEKFAALMESNRIRG